jgi:hypothetical protein
MQAFGSDRVRPGDGEQMVVLSRLSKGWTARVPKTLTSAEFPGTAVLWEERYFEVVIADDLPQGGVRYILEPWLDHIAMRVTDRYDAESEAQRVEEYRKHLQREQGRKSANALGFLTGNLPAVVQYELARELGILPARLTFISLLGMYLILAGIVLLSVHYVMTERPIPVPLLILSTYLGIENTIRILINWTQSRPIGSTLGWIVYIPYHFISGQGPSPFATEKGWSVKITDAPEDVARRDAVSVREPFVTLLTAAEQTRVAQRYGYDYRRESAAVAIMILVVASIGVVSSYMSGALIALIVAVALAAEQIVRLMAFRRGPAGSVLRFVVRPFVRKLL